MQEFNIWNCVSLLRRKSLIILLLMLGAPFLGKAQLNYLEYVNKKIYFGITLGYNSSKFKIERSTAFTFNDSILVVNSTRGPGFNLGIISNLKLGKYFDLRFIPSLAFAEKNLKYTLAGDSIFNKNIESIYIEFPLSVRFKSQPIKDIRIYVLAGMKYNFDLASNAKARKAEDQVKIKNHDLAYEIGIGIQFFFPLFIFSPEFKIANGILDIHSLDQALIFSNSIEKLQSRAFVISLHFEG